MSYAIRLLNSLKRLEESNSMMKQQSSEFIIGYIFAHQELKIIKIKTYKGLILNTSKDEVITMIPLLWFGVKNPTKHFSKPKVDEALVLANEICLKVDENLNDVFIKSTCKTTVSQYKQYLTFITKFVDKQGE